MSNRTEQSQASPLYVVETEIQAELNRQAKNAPTSAGEAYWRGYVRGVGVAKARVFEILRQHQAKFAGVNW